jgi:energy-coupling factor transport system permease protein
MSASRQQALAAFAFTPGSSPLHRAHPAVAAAPLVALGVVALAAGSPLVIGSVGVSAWLLGWACGAQAAMRQALRFSIPLAVLMILVNGLISHAGATVIFRAPEIPIIGGTITLESLAAGGVIASRVISVALLFAIWSACVDPDRVLAALRPVARHSALTATLVSRLVPVAAADFTRLKEGVDLRGPAAAPVGKAELARRVVAGSLDRSVEVAATLELRGHALRPRRRHSSGEAFRRVAADGLWPLVSGCTVAVVAGILLGAGFAGFESYPEVAMEVSWQALMLTAAIPLLTLLSLVPWGLGAKRWSR